MRHYCFARKLETSALDILYSFMERSERIEYLRRRERMSHPASPSRGTMQATREALERGEELNPEEFASRVFGWDCDIVDYTDNVKILESN